MTGCDVSRSARLLAHDSANPFPQKQHLNGYEKLHI